MIEPIAGWSSGTSGNSLIVIGRMARAIIRIKPDSSAIFIVPSHKAMIPIRPIAISTAVFAMSMAA